MNLSDRYVIFKGHDLVWTTNDVTLLVPYLWGRDLRDRYVVFDDVKPYPVDTPDLSAWVKPLEAAARSTP